VLCPAIASREVKKYGVSFMSSDTLRRIKRAVLAGNYAFSEKALLEMEADGLTELDIAESILNAVAIYKTLRSQSPWRPQRTEYLHIIQSTNLDGLMIYSKGKLVEEAGIERYYFLISSKKAL
jgi:hypothetical protein